MTTDEQEPDYRFTLANERTFLAWVRTALAVLACGFALAHFGAEGRMGGEERAFPIRCIGMLLLSSAGGVGVAAYLRWRAVQRAMRRLSPLPESAMMLSMAVLLSALGVAACLAMLR